MINLLFLIFTELSACSKCFLFPQGYVELWYEVPANALFHTEIDLSADSVIKKYRYQLRVYSKSTNDSAVKEGIKLGKMKKGKQQELMIDYLPLHLYPGCFAYELKITSGGEVFIHNGMIEIPSDTESVFLSDIVLSKKGYIKGYIFHNNIVNISFTSNVININYIIISSSCIY